MDGPLVVLFYEFTVEDYTARSFGKGRGPFVTSALIPGAVFPIRRVYN